MPPRRSSRNSNSTPSISGPSNSNSIQPPVQSVTSSKALGKRREIEEPNLVPSPSKKPKLDSKRKLRSSTATTSIKPIVMSARKGSRASRAAKAKARAREEDETVEEGDQSMQDNEEQVLEDSKGKGVANDSCKEGDFDEPMLDQSKLIKESPRKNGVDRAVDSDQDNSSNSEPDEMDDEDQDEDDDDADEAEEEAFAQAQYEAELRGESYEDDLADLLHAPQGFDDNGMPIRTSSSNPSALEAESVAALEAAMDAAENAAMDAAAARQYFAGMGGGGSAFRALHGMMSGMSTRLKGLLTSLKSKDGNATAKLTALQDLAELLSVSTEDTLSGYFQVEAFVKEIVTILKGENVIISDGGSSGMTPEEMVAFGIEPEEGGGVDEESNVQMMLLACRCLANLMEALPGSAHSLVYAGAVPVLCSKLMEIQYIDLAEQTLSTLEKISEEVPSAIVRAGGLNALLVYLDFFSSHVQRTAVTAAANCCRSLSPESFTMVRDVMPIIKNILSYPDRRVVEQACLAVVRISESYRHFPDKLETLLSTDILSAVRSLLNPDSSVIGPGTYTQILKMLSTASKASPQVAITLVELNIANTLYHLLTGSPAPEFKAEDGLALVKVGDEGEMLVMQNLVQRPKDQIQETLSLICELLPPLPKDGIFDSRAHSGKDRSSKNKVKVEDVKIEETTPGLPIASGSIELATEVKMESADELPTPSTSNLEPITRTNSRSSKQRDPIKLALVEKRLELLTSGPETRNLVVKRYYALMLPALIDVYSATVNTQVRTKAVLGLSKIINFCDAESLALIMKTVPISSFLAAILSSRDQTTLITSALQLVELFLIKLPDSYAYYFRREGVMHEIERIAAEPILHVSKSKRLQPKVEPQDDNVPSGIARSLQQNLSATVEPILSPADEQAKDMITRRAIYLSATYIAVDSEPTSKARIALESIQSLVQNLEDIAAGLETDVAKVIDVLEKVVELFADETNPPSSFELLKSGLVEGLLKLAIQTGPNRVNVVHCQELLAKSLMNVSGSASPAFAVLVKRLQESLSRMEEFEVVLAGQNANEVESRRNGPAMLARQLKLRLIAEEGSDIPRSCSNVVVSIHAIATFQAFNDYLRPRILAATTLSDRAAGGAVPGGRLSSFLAAFAAAGDEMDDEPSGSGLSVSPGTTEISTTPAKAGTEKQTRRRSSRLSGKLDPPVTNPASASTSTETLAAAVQEEFEFEEDHELFAAGFDASPPSRDERPVNLEVVGDGSKVVVKTPDGTRVSTPTPGKLSAKSSAAKPRASYAAAVKAEPTDFHLEFSMGEQEVGLETTVYGAVHNFDSATPENRRHMWTNIYTVKFRKVAGPAKVETEVILVEPIAKEVSTIMIMPDSIPVDSQQAKILQLLCVLHSVNSEYGDSVSSDGIAATLLPPTAFVNNKLTAKLNRQLEEPMIVASACLPDWSVDLPQCFPFLFPFETRYAFLQSTAFGYARLMQKWVGQARIDSSRRDDNLGFLGRLQRQKVRISRERMLESAFKVFELYGSSRASLEVEFFSEVGSGLGPTLEFYALVSKEFARKDLALWRDGDVSNPSAFVYNLAGLFPSPTEDFETEAGKKCLKVFRVLGQFIAKALMDSRIIDVNFNRTFMKLVLDTEIPLTVATVQTVDKELGRSLAHLQKYLTLKSKIELDTTKTVSQLVIEVEAITVDGMKITELYLDFTLPGHSILLKPGGKDIVVDMTNLEEYISLVIEWTLQKGISSQMKEFKAGFTTVFPVRDLQSFTPSELVMMTGALEEDWSVETLTNSTKADHGFTMDSRPVRDVISIMSELSPVERREFLSFITGSPRLPIGGFAALSPSLTIVRKDGGDGSLPSVMTCVNYIKLPDYTTREIVRARVMTAVTEGAGGFHLS